MAEEKQTLGVDVDLKKKKDLHLKVFVNSINFQLKKEKDRMTQIFIQVILFIIIMGGHIYLWNLPRTNGRSLSTQKIIDHLKLEGE